MIKISDRFHLATEEDTGIESGGHVDIYTEADGNIISLHVVKQTCLFEVRMTQNTLPKELEGVFLSPMDAVKHVERYVNRIEENVLLAQKVQKEDLKVLNKAK